MSLQAIQGLWIVSVPAFHFIAQGPTGIIAEPSKVLDKEQFLITLKLKVWKIVITHLVQMYQS